MSRIQIKTLDQIRFMREAGLVVADIHRALREACRPGITTLELDRVSADTIAAHGAKSNFLGYYDYPATVCISVNDTIVHGIPDHYQLQAGDLVSFDCGAYLMRNGRQWHGDAAFSMIVGGDEHASLKRQQLNAVTEEAMWAAIAALPTGRRVNIVGRTVEEVVARRAEEFGWEPGIIENFTGHGIGTAMHQEPDVFNFEVRGITPRLKPGMVICIEPMITAGTIDNVTMDDDWTVKTADHSDAAHWEHTIAILEEGISVLTAPDFGEAGLAPYGVIPIHL